MRHVGFPCFFPRYRETNPTTTVFVFASREFEGIRPVQILKGMAQQEHRGEWFCVSEQHRHHHIYTYIYVYIYADISAHIAADISADIFADISADIPAD